VAIVLIAALVAVLVAVAIILFSHSASAQFYELPNGQIAPALEARIDRETHGRLLTVHFYSRALEREADYLIYLPAGYSANRPLAAFYLLHGMPGKPVAFTVNANIEVRLEQLIRARRVQPMLLVFPDGRIDGRTASDSEWANTPSGDYESYITNVMSDVDHRYATLPCRQERAIAGLSAGAYGAANVGLHQDSMFGLIQVWSGYFLETHNGVFAHADRAVMAYNSPIDYVRTMRRTLQRYPLRIFIFGGRDDPDSVQIPPMAAALERHGAHESWAIYPGGHSWNTWTPHVDQMLVMASRDFSRPLGGASRVCT
jgi:enterochelin esterase-like enzyme